MAEDQALTIVKSEPLTPLTILHSEPLQPSSPSDAGALGIQAGSQSIPLAARGAAELATSPAVPRIAAQAGRVIGGIAPVVGGAEMGGIPGAAIGMAGAAKGAWAGGKAGWFTGKLAQNMAAPVAKALETLAPYAQTISTVSGAQGVLDLAQMADQTRKDIGTLGISIETPRTDAEKKQDPTLVDAAIGKISDLASVLKSNGVPAAEALALKLATMDSPQLFGKLMTAYVKKQFGGTP